MRSDSERDGIKREHVIFTQAAVDHWELITSMWVLQPVKFGVGGGILVTPLISPSAFAIFVSAVNICIWSLLAWFSMMRIIYKNDDLDYSQESNCPFVVKYT